MNEIFNVLLGTFAVSILWKIKSTLVLCCFVCLWVFFPFYIKKVQRVPLFSSSVFSLYEKNGGVVGVVVLFVYLCWFCFACFFFFLLFFLAECMQN